MLHVRFQDAVPTPRGCRQIQIVGDMRVQSIRIEIGAAVRVSEPCVGCGRCCLGDQCEVSHRLHGYKPRCPDLLWDTAANRYVCLLMLNPERGAAFKAELYAGEGCCSPDNPWRRDVRNRDLEP